MANIEMLQSMLDSMSPEDRQKTLEAFARQYKSERETLAGDMAFSEDMMDDPGPGELIDAGRFKIARTPMAHAASALRQGVGALGRRKARQGLDETQGAEQGVIQQLQAALLRNSRTPPAAGPAPAPGGMPGRQVPWT